MSLAITYSRALAGLHAELVTVEVHLANGLPAFNLVGLADTEVRESRDRVRAAIQTAGFEFPVRKLTVNLAPAEFPKESGRFDLPIAIGILVASGQLPATRLKGLEFAGELGLNGDLRPVRGALAMALAAARTGIIGKEEGFAAHLSSLVSRGYLYPFVNEELSARGAPAEIPFHIARLYARSRLPWEVQNQPWALMAIKAAN